MGKKGWALIAVAVILGSILILMVMDSDKGPQYEIEPTHKSVSYGPDQRNKMDIYIPEGDGGQHSAFFFIHGGGWSEGDKAEGSGLAKGLMGAGCAVVSINYRFLSDTPENVIGCEEILDDIGRAMNFIKDHGSEYGLNADRIAIGGSSAGAHLAMMYAYSVQNKPIDIAFVMSFSGPTDLTDVNYYNGTSVSWVAPLIKKLAKIDSLDMSDPNVLDRLEGTSPVHHLKVGSPPILIAHGVKDDIVPYTNAITMDSKMTVLGVEHELFLFENSGHSLDSSEDEVKRTDFFTAFWNYIQNYLLS